MCSTRRGVVAVFALGVSTAFASSAYDEFRLLHRGKTEDGASVGYAERLALFEARRAQVAAHNARNESWKLAVNHFADWTPGELRATLGYKRVGGRWAQSPGGSSLVQQGDSEDESIDTSLLAQTVDWRSKLDGANFVHDQGACGSCWAHAAVSAVEAWAELKTGRLPNALATQQIIDCTANPHHCGGTGGCHGATSELAFERARLGLAFAADYEGGNRTCSASTPAALKVPSFVRLPENKGSHLMHAVSTKGPVVTSVDANGLHMYSSGVYSGCKHDTIPNHAVVTVGYGKDPASLKKYWLIKNSWSERWGERGYLRLQRHDRDDEYCGVDVKPQEGVYCEGAPSSIRVCGMCGCTSDSSYPIVATVDPSDAPKVMKAQAHNVLGRSFLGKSPTRVFSVL